MVQFDRLKSSADEADVAAERPLPDNDAFIFKRPVTPPPPVGDDEGEACAEPKRPITPPSPDGLFAGFSVEADPIGAPAFLSTSTMTESEGADVGDLISYSKLDDAYMASTPSVYSPSFLSMPMPLNLIEALVDIGIEEAGAPLPSRFSLELLSNAALTAAKTTAGDAVATASQERATRALTRMLERFAVIWEDYCKELAAGAVTLEHQSSTATTAATGSAKDASPYFFGAGFNYDTASALAPLTATTAEPPTPEGSPQVASLEPTLRRPKSFSGSSSNSNNSLSAPSSSPSGVPSSSHPAPPSTAAHAATPFNTLPQHLVDPKDWCTVILRNIPNKYDEVMLLEQFAASGFSSDSHIRYVYTPKDATNNCNLGYAFVDLINHEVAVRFTSVYEGFRLPSSKSRKVCSANWAKMQSVPAPVGGSLASRVGGLSTTGRRDSRILSGVSSRKASLTTATPRRHSRRGDNLRMATPPGLSSSIDKVASEVIIVGIPSRRYRGQMVELLSCRFGPVISCLIDDNNQCKVTFESSAVARSAKDAIIAGTFEVDGKVVKLAENTSDRGYGDDDSDLQFNVGPLDDYLTQ
ncbi:hypothetical protein FOZ60_003216 [Perkinsus olseni]|uniref:Mei2-like C-terminal RNA recognition motif domain-containing protein n=2 Tax=Perkinsus olseni TaxID=32597 RepID=A0A7J6NWW7_PEROL|nr:hypothetical protein FOZ60_003216 [Perkinsus olseni]